MVMMRYNDQIRAYQEGRARAEEIRGYDPTQESLGRLEEVVESFQDDAPESNVRKKGFSWKRTLVGTAVVIALAGAIWFSGRSFLSSKRILESRQIRGIDRSVYYGQSVEEIFEGYSPSNNLDLVEVLGGELVFAYYDPKDIEKGWVGDALYDLAIPEEETFNTGDPFPNNFSFWIQGVDGEKLHCYARSRRGREDYKEVDEILKGEKGFKNFVGARGIVKGESIVPILTVHSIDLKVPVSYVTTQDLESNLAWKDDGGNWVKQYNLSDRGYQFISDIYLNPE